MHKKWPIKLLQLFTELIMFGFLIFVCTCEDAPLNPYNCSSSRINLLLRSSTLAESDLQIQDAPMKSFQLVANCVMTAYMDSIRFQIINDKNMVDKDTVIANFPKSTGIEKITCNTSLLSPGARIVKVIAYLNACQPISDSASVIITDYPQNTKPEIRVVGSVNVLVNSVCTLDVYATDLEQSNAQLVYAVPDLPAGATFKDQRFIWKPAQAGIYTVTFKVTDNGIPPLSSQSVKTISVVTLIEQPSKPLSLTVIGRDQSTVGLKWRSAARTDNYSIYLSRNRTGVYEKSKTIQDTTCIDTCSADSWYYYVSAKNSAGEVSSDTIEVPSFDKNKSIWNASEMSYNLQEGEAYTIDLRQLCKSLIQNVTFSIKESAPLHDAINGTFYEYTPSFDDSGTYTVLLTAVSGSVSDEMTFKIHVTNVNRAPMFQADMPPAFYFIPSSNQLRIPVRASDPDGDVVKYAIKSTTLPRSQELQFNLTNDTLLWTKTSQDDGTYSIVLAASDKENSVITSIQVYTEEKALKPVWKSNNLIIKIKEAEKYTLSLADSCQDPNGDKVSFMLISEGVRFDTIVNNSLYIIAPAFKDSGDYNNIRIVASDGTLTDTLHLSIEVADSVDVNVGDVPPAPLNITASKETIEAGDSTLLSASAVKDAALKWFIGKCDGTVLSKLTVTPLVTTTYYVRAENGCCYSECISKTIIVKTPETTKPSVRFTDPLADSKTSASTYAVKAVAKDASGIKSVIFRCGSKEYAGTAGSNDSIYNASIDLALGTNTITVVAVDKSINANRDSAAVTLTRDPTIIDNIGPVISKGNIITLVTSPNVSISCTITDDSNVDSVQWTLNSGAWQTIAVATDNKYVINAVLTSFHTNKIIIRAVDKSTNRNIRNDTTAFDYNVAPKVKDTAFAVDMNGSKAFTLYADPVDGDALTGWTIVTAPKSGALSGSAPSLTYNAPPVFTPFDTIAYSVKDAAGNTSNTGKVIITINDTRVAPKIGTQPVSPGTVCAGSPVSMMVTVTQGNDLTYVWKRGTSVVGSNSPTLSISSVTAGDAGSYTVTVSNSKGSETSSAAVLSVSALSSKPTAVSASPSTICAGGSSVLSASGTGLKWYTTSNGTGSALTSTTVAPSVTTTYYVRSESTTCPGSELVPVTVTVNPKPDAPYAVNTARSGVICTNNPSSNDRLFGYINDANCRVVWYSNAAGTDSIGPDGVTVRPSVTTKYYCRSVNTVTGCKSDVSSKTVTITVPSPLTIGAIASQTVCAGQQATFYSSVTGGTPPYNYDWRNSDNTATGMSADASYMGVTTNAAISSVATFGYYVTVTDATGCTVTSSPFSLTVNPLPVLNEIWNSSWYECQRQGAGTEAWIQINAQPGTTVYVVVKNSSSPSYSRTLTSNGDLVNVSWLAIGPPDFTIPAGTISVEYWAEDNLTKCTSAHRSWSNPSWDPACP
jgi:Ig-like domain CHU_C associated/Immunoglobulin I-set domain